MIMTDESRKTHQRVNKSMIANKIDFKYPLFNTYEETKPLLCPNSQSFRCN